MKNIIAAGLSLSLFSAALPSQAATIDTVTSLAGSATSINENGFPDSSIDFTATVISADHSVPTGVVSFFDITTNSYIPGGGSVPLTNGTAQLDTAFAKPGLYRIEALYSGTSLYLGSTSPAFIVDVLNPNAPPVPLPGTVLLMGSALIGLFALQRSRRPRARTMLACG